MGEYRLVMYKQGEYKGIGRFSPKGSLMTYNEKTVYVIHKVEDFPTTVRGIDEIILLDNETFEVCNRERIRLEVIEKIKGN